MSSVYGSNANLDAGVVPKVGAIVIEAALLAQRTACLLLLLITIGPMASLLLKVIVESVLC